MTKSCQIPKPFNWNKCRTMCIHSHTINTHSFYLESERARARSRTALSYNPANLFHGSSLFCHCIWSHKWCKDREIVRDRERERINRMNRAKIEIKPMNILWWLCVVEYALKNRTKLKWYSEPQLECEWKSDRERESELSRESKHIEFTFCAYRCHAISNVVICRWSWAMYSQKRITSLEVFTHTHSHNHNHT